MNHKKQEPGEKLLITLCTYNECENLPLLIPQIHEYAPDADVLVIDDDSPDGTGQLADQMIQADSRIHVLHRIGERGLGTATVAGFRFALEQKYDFVLNMDADFSHHPRYLPAIRACLDSADVGIGSRYVPGGGVVGWNLKRHFMSRSINLYARLLLGLSTRDNSGSFRCYRVPYLAKLDFGQVRSRGYSFQEEILYMCRRVGCRFKETPIVFEDRRFGLSKINRKEAVMAVWVLFRLAVDRAARRRVTMPVSTSRPPAL
ncbi:MAG: polyprenol monophosphomannose synthase [Planctomycetota bacterium]|nr:polyprenol monophosphomannose synthase [Planctomycetota bacterium]